MDLYRLETALADLPLGQIRYYPQIGSTNDEAARWASLGAPDFALVVADEQVAGRGRLNRSWFTPPGSALAFSLVMRPDPYFYRNQNLLAHISALGAVAVSAALGSLTDEQSRLRIEIKWPNDVLIERKKVAGILSEAHWYGSELLAVILGIGINIAPSSVPSDIELLFPATCVESELGRPVDRIDFLRRVLEQLFIWRPHLAQPRFLQAWEDQLAFRGEWVKISDGIDGDPQTGRSGQVVGLDAEGCLKLLDPAGQLFTVRTGEVGLRPASRKQEERIQFNNNEADRV